MGFVILTGASGSGKTAISDAIASRYTESVDVYHFDQVGVPSPEEMVANSGPRKPGNGQRRMSGW